MFEIGVKQGSPLSPTLIILYNDELETYLDRINMDFPCLYNTFFAIALYVDDDDVALILKRVMKTHEEAI